MGASIDISGLDDLLNDLQSLGVKASRAETQALKAAGEVVAEAEKRHLNRSDKNHKHLIDDITVSNPQTKDGVKSVYVGPTEKTAYRARFLEHGTSKMPAYPFILPAANEAEQPATEAMVEALRDALR